jgi:putative hydrolase of the HAD superfamily
VRGEFGFWREFLGRVRLRLDGGPLSEDAFGRLAAHFRGPGAWMVFPDVLPTLEALAARGLPLAVVSNWDSDLPRVLDRTGLAGYFRTVSVSAIEATGKPEPEIFRRTCARLSVQAAEVLHVGDSLREDFEGARGAGLTALLLDRKDLHPDVPDRIRSLSDLLQRI